MQEKKIVANGPMPDNHYRMWFRCTNCGALFQYDIRMGTTAIKMNGNCPECGVKSGTANIGVFTPIKFNPTYDEVQRHYFK